MRKYSSPRNIETGQAPCEISNIENKAPQANNINPKIKKTVFEVLW